ncbi:MAG: hypothetical protein JNL01_02425 [Bdellovibrionales bacterium]|nr:hypothetical protein [Bdellovibrionales bacterium]
MKLSSPIQVGLSALAVSISLLGCGSDKDGVTGSSENQVGPAPQAIYENWAKTERYPNGQSKTHTVRFFRDGIAVFNTICAFPSGAVVRATVQGNVKLTNKTIEVLTRAKDLQKDANGNECQCEIEPGKVTYRIAGIQLYVLADDEEVVFTRQ